MVSKSHSEKSGTGSNTVSSRQLFSLPRHLSKTDRLFLSGAILGVGCSILFVVAVDYFRIQQRFRIFWRSLWTEEPQKDTSDANWCESAPLKAARDFLVKTDDGSIRMIVTPKKAVTSNLNVTLLTLLTLHPGREISSTKSVGVEFYYVVSGSGSFSQQGVTTTGRVQAGDCFVIHPFRIRWISNGQGKEDLVLLRASDDGSWQYNRERSSLDRIRMDPTRLFNPMNRLKESLRKVSSFARSFSSSNNMVNQT
jgi:mannose-6-phosphate isomerase-like protein (cupin superfamily)